MMDFTIANADPTITCGGDETVECLLDVLLYTADTADDFTRGAQYALSCVYSVTITNDYTAHADDCPNTFTVTITMSPDCGRTGNVVMVLTIANAELTRTDVVC